MTSKNIKNGTIQTVDLSAKAKTALKGSRGAQGPAGIQTLQAVTNTVSVVPDDSGDITATCPAGRSAVSGGFVFNGILNAGVNTGTGWRVIGFNDLLTAQNLSAVAYCSPNVTVTAALVNSGKTELTVGARRSAGN